MSNHISRSALRARANSSQSWIDGSTQAQVVGPIECVGAFTGTRHCCNNNSGNNRNISMMNIDHQNIIPKGCACSAIVGGVTVPWAMDRYLFQEEQEGDRSGRYWSHSIVCGFCKHWHFRHQWKYKEVKSISAKLQCCCCCCLYRSQHSAVATIDQESPSMDDGRCCCWCCCYLVVWWLSSRAVTLPLACQR